MLNYDIDETGAVVIYRGEIVVRKVPFCSRYRLFDNLQSCCTRGAKQAILNAAVKGNRDEI